MFNLARFKKLCKEQGITQTALFARVGRKPQYSSDIAKGAKVPLEYVDIWAEALHTTPAYLLGETDDPTPAAQKKEQPAKGEPSPIDLEISKIVNQLPPERQAQALDYLHYLLAQQAAADS